jgi:hypothetical protein
MGAPNAKAIVTRRRGPMRAGMKARELQMETAS